MNEIVGTLFFIAPKNTEMFYLSIVICNVPEGDVVLSYERPEEVWTNGMEDLLRSVIKKKKIVTWKAAYRHAMRILESETRKRNRRLMDIETKVLGGCGRSVGTRVTHYVERDPHWPIPIRTQERSSIPCMGSIIAKYKIYSNGDVEAEARCGACGRFHDSMVTLGDTPTPWSVAMCSLRDEPYWREFVRPYLEMSIREKKKEELEKKRVEEERIRKEEESRIKREAANLKRKETRRRNQEIQKILQSSHQCPHCGSSRTYGKQDIIKGSKAKVTCTKWRCKKEFIIQDIAALF